MAMTFCHSATSFDFNLRSIMI